MHEAVTDPQSMLLNHQRCHSVDTDRTHGGQKVSAQSQHAADVLVSLVRNRQVFAVEGRQGCLDIMLDDPIE